jgi:hypothetical protein
MDGIGQDAGPEEPVAVASEGAATRPGLSTYREGSLHASLKAMYARPGDRVEHNVSGFVIDVARDDLLVEIQTASFSSAARKLRRLVDDHAILLVYPLPLERWLVKVDADGAVLSRRRSPKRGHLVDLFDQLVSFPELVTHPNFEIDVVAITEEEIRGPVPDGARYRYPRDWWRLDRRLIDVMETRHVAQPSDLRLLAPDLPDRFTSADVAACARRTRRVAMRTVYCLAKSGAARAVGKRGRLLEYEWA